MCGEYAFVTSLHKNDAGWRHGDVINRTGSSETWKMADYDVIVNPNASHYDVTDASRRVHYDYDVMYNSNVSEVLQRVEFNVTFRVT